MKILVEEIGIVGNSFVDRFAVEKMEIDEEARVREARKVTMSLACFGLGLLVASAIGIAGYYGSKPELKTENVIGQEAPEKFYEISGKRVYLEIDGKPLEQYLKGE